MSSTCRAVSIRAPIAIGAVPVLLILVAALTLPEALVVLRCVRSDVKESAPVSVLAPLPIVEPLAYLGPVLVLITQLPELGLLFRNDLLPVGRGLAEVFGPVRKGAVQAVRAVAVLKHPAGPGLEEYCLQLSRGIRCKPGPLLLRLLVCFSLPVPSAANPLRGRLLVCFSPANH